MCSNADWWKSVLLFPMSKKYCQLGPCLRICHPASLDWSARGPIMRSSIKDKSAWIPCIYFNNNLIIKIKVISVAFLNSIFMAKIYVCCPPKNPKQWKIRFIPLWAFKEVNESRWNIVEYILTIAKPQMNIFTIKTNSKFPST